MVPKVYRDDTVQGLNAFLPQDVEWTPDRSPDVKAVMKISSTTPHRSGKRSDMQ